jgi:AraC-like DNA-binding protein
MAATSRILIKFALIIPIFILIIIVILVSLLNKPLLLFPHETYKNRITAYSDKVTGGNSQIIDFNILDNKIILTYILGKNRSPSFAGLIFDVSFLDISHYDIMEVQLDITCSVRYLVTLISFVEGKSRLSELDTLVHYNKAVTFEENKHFYTIDLRSMVKSAYRKYEMEETVRAGGIRNTDRPNNLLFIHIKEIVKADTFQESSKTLETVKTLIIENISFKKSYATLYFILIGVVCLYYLFFIFFRMIWIRKKKKIAAQGAMNPPFIQLDVETYEKADLKKIMDMIRERVFDPDFSIHDVYHATGLSESRTSHLIKNKYHISFKQFINAIRLNEAKRLLLETDLKIYDIAFKTGYNNNTYFCKLFKKQFGLSPREVRDSNIQQTNL